MEETSIEECLRKKTVAAKTKKVVNLSAQQATDPTEDAYLTAFHTGALFEMLGDLVQLAAWWSKRQ